MTQSVAMIGLGKLGMPVAECMAKHYKVKGYDIADKKSPMMVLDDFKKFADLVNEKIDECSIVFIPIKPSPSRWGFWEKMKKANSLIKVYAKNNEKVFYIDTVSPMIGKNGKPKSDLFVKDSLHLNSNGYDLWSLEVNSFLDSLTR